MKSSVVNVLCARCRGARLPASIVTRTMQIALLTLTVLASYTPAWAGHWDVTYTSNGVFELSIEHVDPLAIDFSFDDLIFSESMHPADAWAVYGGEKQGVVGAAGGNVDGWVQAKLTWVPDSSETPSSVITVTEESWAIAGCRLYDPGTTTTYDLLPLDNTDPMMNPDPSLELDNGFADSVVVDTIEKRRVSDGTHYTNANVVWNSVAGVYEATLPARYIKCKFNVGGPISPGDWEGFSDDTTSVEAGFVYTASVP